MSLGKTIQIFLPDGNPRSIKIAEITSRTVLAMLIPRAKLTEALNRKELKNVGIYFLIGDSEEGSRPLLYIGEAEDCNVRLKQQNKAKDFWNVALVVISKTQYFTKTHIKFLESFCYFEAEKALRFKIDNSTIPTKPFVSEPMEADLLDNFDTIKSLVATLGYPIFDQIKKPTKKDLVFCKSKDADASGEYTEDGMIVFKGSKCNLTEAPSAGRYVKNNRKKLLDEGILQLEKNVYIFQADYIFSSPTPAAVAVLGRRANGWTEWKYINGNTLDFAIRQKE